MATKTPKKPVLHGSLSSDKDPIPHVCFLINGFAVASSEGQSCIKQQLVRLLLLFHTQINPDFTWSFEFAAFKKGSSSVSTSMGLDERSLLVFERELQRCRASSQGSKDIDQTPENLDFTIVDLVESLKRLSVQSSRWTQNTAALFQSPFKIADSTWVNWNGSVKLRNYLIILSPLPGINGKASLQPLLGQHTSDQELSLLLDTFRSEFLNQEFWINLMKARTSLFWMDPFSITQRKDVSLEKLKEASAIDACTMSILRQFGGACINNATLNSTEFVQLMTPLYRSAVVDMSAAKNLFIPSASKSKKEAFLEIAEKSLLPPPRLKILELWRGDMQFQPPSSTESRVSQEWPADIPTSFSITLTGRHATSHTTDTRDSLENAEIKILYILPVEQVAIDYGDLHCFSNGDQESFGLLMSYLSSKSCVLVLRLSTKDGYTTEGFLKPNFATLASLQLLGRIISPQITEEILLPLQEDTALSPNQEILDIWFSPWQSYLKTFLQTGKILAQTSEIIGDLCMGIWCLERATLEPTPKKPALNKSRLSNTIKEETEQQVFHLEPCETIQQVLESLSYYYSCILFGKYSLEFLMDTIFPAFYTQLFNLATEKGDEEYAAKALLFFFTDSLCLSIEEIEKRHQMRPKELLFLVDSASSMPDDARESLLKKNWFIKYKETRRVKEDDEIEPKTLLKNAIKDLRLLESQLQIVIWLECMKMSQKHSIEIPFKLLFQRNGGGGKKKKKAVNVDMKTHINDAVNVLADKLLIWTVGFDDQQPKRPDQGLWSVFIKPILLNHYQSQFPELVASLAEKTGGDGETHADGNGGGEDNNRIIASPFFKKGPTKKVTSSKPIPAKKQGKVKKAPSKSELIRKRTIAPIQVAKRKRNEVVDGKMTSILQNKESSKKKEVSMDHFFKPKTPGKRGGVVEEVFVPETPSARSATSKYQKCDTTTPSAKRAKKIDIFSPVWQ